MNPDSHHRRFSPVMWATIGVAFMVLALVAVYRIAGYTVGALVVVCLAVCGATFWFDARTARATDRLIEQVRHRPSR